MIGLGKSVGGNVTAEVFVVTNWDDLEANKDKLKDKIVCYATDWVDYDVTVQYRSSGASRACKQEFLLNFLYIYNKFNNNLAKYGALAVLVRSVTPFSIESPHTGVMGYDEAYPKIPAAAIAVEDAYMMKRMQARG